MISLALARVEYCITFGRDEFAVRSRPFRELVAPYLVRMDAAIARNDPLATYVEESGPSNADGLLKRYRRAVAWPVRQLEYGFVLTAAPPRKGSRVLDAGCGITPLAHVYANAGAEAHGVDFDPQLMEMMNRTGEALYGGTVEYSAGDITQLKYENETFDVVTSVSVLEHLPRGLDTKAVSEMLRVLKPGGTLAITVDVTPTPTPMTVATHLRRVAKAIRRTLTGERKPKPRTIQYTVDDVHRQLMEPFGDLLGSAILPTEVTLDSIRAFWTENWTEGAGYDPIKGRPYTALGLAFRKC